MLGMFPLKTISIAALVALTTTGAASAGDNGQLGHTAKGPENPLRASETWEILRSDVTDAETFLDGNELFYFQAPKAAYDPAYVPFTIRQKRGTGERVTHLTIVVDENPAPMAAAFEFGPLIGDLYLDSRVRYDTPSNIRAIAKTDKGNTYMVGRFVNAAGGCAAGAPKDPVAALKGVGKMKLRQFKARGSTGGTSGTVRQAQLKIRHPNFTGMQTNADGSPPIEARFVDMIEVRLGDELLFRMTGGFSISEDPSFRFTFIDNGAQAITVHATDTTGAVFKQVLPLAPGA